ncbi:hypothetical protein SAMN05421874_14020 [Nonomuraea maritima]|uniref:Type VII secretion protein EccE n=1 Tax=Nonomuraea maritima TaxID=683260 RepID=A0A1G9QQD4_9ACTN|nr:hypothetical protein [Nonomuraea maritima]SDM13218.1 hypothetical protein SAMN05421874_14020 [Nonomuraea maritima]
MNPVMGALFAVLGFLVLFGTLLHLTVRGVGGWRAVGRGLRRQAALTAAAFTAPVRSQLRFRRRRRLLVQLLGRPDGLRLAERAAAQAAAVDPAVMPYGALLDPAYVGVLVAAAPGVPRPPDPWIVDDDNPRLWWLEHADVAPYLVGQAPLLVTLGADDEHVVLLDVLSGPATVAVQGDSRLARAVVASVGAQLDARLPRGAVTVSEGVHDRHPGPDPAGAVSAAHHWAASWRASGPASDPGSGRVSGPVPGFAVCAAAPPHMPADVRLIAAGTVRGTARLVVAHADGIVDVHGTPLRADAIALPRALASVLRSLPPYARQEGPGSDLTEPPPSAQKPAAPPYAPTQRRATDLTEVLSGGGEGDPRSGGVVPVTADTAPRSGGVVSVPVVGAGFVMDRDLVEPEEPGRPSGVSASAS